MSPEDVSNALSASAADPLNLVGTVTPGERVVCYLASGLR